MRLGPLVLLMFSAFSLHCAAVAVGSCDVPDAGRNGYGYCATYYGASYTSSTVMAECAHISGNYAASSCPPGLHGTCEFNDGESTAYANTYENPQPLADGGSIDFNALCTAAGGTLRAQ